MKKLIALFLMSGWGPAQAIPVLWTLDGATFRNEVDSGYFQGEDGSSISGSFIYDADTNMYSDITITVESAVTSYPFIWEEQTYTNPVSWDGANSVTLLNYGVGATCPLFCFTELSLVFAAPLTNSGGTIFLDTPSASRETLFSNEMDVVARRIASGTLTGTVVPIPAAVWLFGSALAGLSMLRRRAAAP